ncbi:MAG: hypothetical protein R3C44_11090 [Chloroflexota bacterium]
MSLAAIDWDDLLAGCVDFTQRLIRTPSMPGDEAAIGQLVAEELRRLGYDEVWQDGIGNVFGRIYGRDRSLPALVLNTHLDHVDVGDPALWPAHPLRPRFVTAEFWAAVHVISRTAGRPGLQRRGTVAVRRKTAA